MSDIVDRLRSGEDGLEYAAADEIERLRTEWDMWRVQNLMKQIACEQMGARITALEAERDRLRAGLLRAIQYENKCDETGKSCDASKGCACSLEAETWCRT